MFTALAPQCQQRRGKALLTVLTFRWTRNTKRTHPNTQKASHSKKKTLTEKDTFKYERSASKPTGGTVAIVAAGENMAWLAELEPCQPGALNWKYVKHDATTAVELH